MADFLFGPTPHKEAMEFIKDKPAVSREVFGHLLPELKPLAFAITGVEAANTLQSIRDRIADLPAGANWEDVKADLVNELHPFLRSEDDPENTLAAERRAELLLRTHGFQAYQQGAYAVMEQQTDVLPYWQYVSMEDDRVRPEHAALNGIVLPADHEFWRTHFPPWGFGCRCQAIPISQADHDEIAAKDKQRNPDNRLILDEHAQRELTTSRRLVRNGVPYNLTSPAEEHKPGAYAWHPGELRLSVDALRARYDATTFGMFEAWARSHAIERESKTTVWGWLNGAEILPGKLLEPSSVTDRAVSAALKVKTVGAHRGMLRHALAMIDQVHSDGDLPEIPVDNRRYHNALGVFFRTRGTPSAPLRISVTPLSPWPHLTALHEIGHFLDFCAVGAPGEFASETELVNDWLAVTGKSDPVMQIFQEPNLKPKQREYLLKPRELWARSYAQYIVTKSGDPLLLAELDRVRKGPEPWRQWTDAEFRPILKQMDKLFRKKGWV